MLQRCGHCSVTNITKLLHPSLRQRCANHFLCQSEWQQTGGTHEWLVGCEWKGQVVDCGLSFNSVNIYSTQTTHQI